MVRCPLCWTDLDPDGPAVLGFGQGEARSYMWQPFIEDLRTSSPVLIHPQCYAQDHGLHALLKLITASDGRQWADAFRVHKRIMELEQRLRSSD
jgi:hypothetical protein